MATVTEVGTSLTTIYESVAGFSEYLGFKVENDDGAALNAFQFQVKMSKIDTDDSTAETWESITISTDLASPWPVASTTDLTSLGTDSVGSLMAVGRHWAQIRLQASVASGTTNVTVYATGG
jgi:hypothetical protein